LSKRRDKIFFPLTCSAIPSTLLETELFGYVKGAFTGASRDKLGCFDYANGGTLFLNEIGDMPLELQAKLLDVLQDGDIKPVGGCTYHPVNVRIIAATNKDLTALIKDNQFREDLYYRLNVINICIPPLRGRISEVPKLATQFLNKFNDALNKSVFFSQGALQKLQDYNWPGNVRQLNHVIEKTVILATKQEIEAEDIDIVIPPAYPFIIPEPSEDFSLENYSECLVRTSANI
jgi:transcriptional regulator with GAF, ATPase, and Fis domain